MDECIISEITIGRKKVFFVVVYRSPSQNAESFHYFLDKLKTTVQTLKDKKPHCIILTGDFSYRSDIGGLMMRLPQKVPSYLKSLTVIV